MTPRDDRKLAELRAVLARASGATLRRLEQELADDDRAGVAEALEAARSRERARRREDARMRRLSSIEDELRAEGCCFAAGVDEVGRGALAGPLTVGACILPASPRVRWLDDSKQLTPARREELAEKIKAVALCWNVVHIAPMRIDDVGMTAALREGMLGALEGLEHCAERVLIDGLPMRIHPAERAVVGGDGKVAAIAAASIVAKVTRDALMVELAPSHACYSFEENKGYGTPEHVEAIRLHGLTPYHRRSFAPCGGMEHLF